MTTETEPQGFCSVYKPTIWQRMGFNYAHAPLLDDEAFPDWPEGSFICETFIKLSWADRLRILVSGKAHVQTRSKTNVSIERAHTSSHFRVLPPTYHRPKR